MLKNGVWLEWHTEEVTVRNGEGGKKQRKTKCKTFTAKKGNDNSWGFFFFFFFLSALVLYVAVSHNDLKSKTKRWFHIMTTNRRYGEGELTCTMRVTSTTNAIKGKKGRGGSEGGATMRQAWLWICLTPVFTCPKETKAPDFRHPDEVLNRTQQRK